MSIWEIRFQALPVSAESAELAAALYARYNLRTPNAIQVAMALYAGCDVFLTNNGKHFHRLTEL